MEHRLNSSPFKGEKSGEIFVQMGRDKYQYKYKYFKRLKSSFKCRTNRVMGPWVVKNIQKLQGYHQSNIPIQPESSLQQWLFVFQLSINNIFKHMNKQIYTEVLKYSALFIVDIHLKYNDEQNFAIMFTFWKNWWLFLWFLFMPLVF